ncbi:uncharacterized protein METZ01_LOCUS82357 [marine metagenome]|uniref:Uncharacterized protein n=1 Tax=marine metagenome TaxID=408172 RepID=A0A381URQ1_9ZZZZ
MNGELTERPAKRSHGTDAGQAGRNTRPGYPEDGLLRDYISMLL